MSEKNFLRRYMVIGLMAVILWPSASAAATPRDLYVRAEVCYKKLRHDATRQKYRDNWLRCVSKFEAVYKRDADGPWAAAGLYMSGVLYQELYKRSYRKSDIREAADIFKRIIRRFPGSKYRSRAQAALRKLRQDHAEALARASSNKTVQHQAVVARKYKKKTFAKKNPVGTAIRPTSLAAAETSKVTVEGLRFWSNPSYTRVVIDADVETAYHHRLLKKDPSINKPQRLYVDLENSRMGEETQRRVPINDNLLIDARAAQYTPKTVRVVVDIESFQTYKVFSLKNPFRIVIDVWGDAGKDARVIPSALSDVKIDSDGKGRLAKQLALGVRRIVVDAGHGGRDYGAPGRLKGVHEKNVALAIAKRLARKIDAKLHCEVIMTRTGDRYLTLEERTAIANTKNADLFISIHTNASRDPRAFGIETYFLNLATDNEAILVAARENATSTKNISDLQAILNDLMQNAKINESSRLAGFVQDSLHRHMRKRYGQIKSKGVKQAPFYVLLGAQMPAVLVETSFISNARECKRLVNPRYQEHLCDAIVNGIRKYILETNPTAFLKAPPNRGLQG